MGAGQNGKEVAHLLLHVRRICHCRQNFLADQGPNPEDIAMRSHDTTSRSRWLSEALQELTAREQTIIRARRLVDAGATLEELGRELGVSKERVRQLERDAKNKLRSNLMRHQSQLRFSLA